MTRQDTVGGGVATALASKSELVGQAASAYEALREKDVLTGCTSYVQRKLQCGYNRAATILEILEKLKIISDPDALGARKWIASDEVARAALKTAGGRE